MKKFLFLLVIGIHAMLSAQMVTLNSVVRTHDNSDAFLYRVPLNLPEATYLGEIEVQGFSANDAQVFGMIYKKAKSIGANSFAWQPFSAIDEAPPKLDPNNYRLALYYTPYAAIPVAENSVYLLGAAHTKHTVAVNKQPVVFQPRTYTSFVLQPGETVTVSTRRLLGSSIRLAAGAGQPEQYFQISGFGINAERGAGINLKSGDIIKLEQSYAQFLTTVYTYFNPNIQ